MWNHLVAVHFSPASTGHPAWLARMFRHGGGLVGVGQVLEHDCGSLQRLHRHALPPALRPRLVPACPRLLRFQPVLAIGKHCLPALLGLVEVQQHCDGALAPVRVPEQGRLRVVLEAVRVLAVLLAVLVLVGVAGTAGALYYVEAQLSALQVSFDKQRQQTDDAFAKHVTALQELHRAQTASKAVQ